MKYFKTFFIILLFICNHNLCKGQLNWSDQEKECLQTFNEFRNYIVVSIERHRDISDTSSIKYVLLNYIFAESNLDTLDRIHFKKNEISDKSLNDFTSEFSSFYQYFFERNKISVAQHISAIPIRLSSESCIYEKLIPYQQQYTFVYFDDRNPKKILGYLLFVPKFKDKIKAPRILSWTLQFEAGNWAFRSPMGTVGIEYFISEGVKGPEHPIGK